MKFVYDDGGRTAAGFQGHAGDCVARAIAIASTLPYEQVYNALAAGTQNERQTKRGGKISGKKTAREGIHTSRQWFKEYMVEIGFQWVPTMYIGSGCRVHLHDGELPMGRLVVAVSKHYTCVIDGAIHDTHDPQRDAHFIEPDHGQPLRPGQWRNENGVCSIQRRCVYGFWQTPAVLARRP